MAVMAMTICLGDATFSHAAAVEPLVWEQRTDALQGNPAARYSHGLAYDSIRKRVVLFGGARGASVPFLDDTWEWDGRKWELRVPKNRPAARTEHVMAYDSGRRRVVLLGGQAATPQGALPARDVWEWDGADWQSRGATPEAQYFVGATYDSARGRIVASGLGVEFPFGHSTWEWDGTAWTKFSRKMSDPPASKMAYDSVRKRTVLFGSGQTWEWDGGTWSMPIPSGGVRCASAPQSRTNFTLVFDELRARTLLVGGISSANKILSDSWEWDGTCWSVVPGNTVLPGRAGAGGVAESATGRLLLFGGAGPGANNDLWSWDGRTWTELVPGSSPPGQLDSYAVAYDAVRRVTVIFGGFAPTGISGLGKRSRGGDW